VAAPPARGAPRMDGFLVLLLLCGLLLRHLDDHLPPCVDRSPRILRSLAPLSRVRTHRATFRSAVARRARCRGSLSHRDAPLGCGSAMYVTPSTTRDRPTASSSATFPQKRSIARAPTSSTTRGRRSASSTSSQGAQRAISAGDGRRSPLPLADRPGKHLVIAVRYGRCASSIPARASQRRSSAPERPLKGRPVVTSTVPGAWPTIAIRSRIEPARIGRACSSKPAATHFVHARMRA
jgi:hypothetical protein